MCKNVEMSLELFIVFLTGKESQIKIKVSKFIWMLNILFVFPSQRQKQIKENHKSYYAISTTYVYGQEKYLLVRSALSDQTSDRLLFGLLLCNPCVLQHPRWNANLSFCALISLPFVVMKSCMK